ncbi:MAG: TIGR00282 family metallophosphoesterase [Alphaproteobacteria bacterium]|nr:TIGR00282 family metallophosphoesterase [Alphaproteobacteria bacterium]
MKILFCGDVVGRAGREVILQQIPKIKEMHSIDAVVTNGENAAHGFGITSKICNQFHDCGVDVITTGNHVWDQRELIPHIGKSPNIIRPANKGRNTPGKGFTIFETVKGKKILVILLAGRLFMDPAEDPFGAMDEILKSYSLGKTVDAIIVDFHAEATSEKNAMGHYLDGKVSLVVGTHTHIPTADVRIMKGGTGYMTDAGMCGDYDSVIGMKAEAAIHRFVSDLPGEKLSPARNKGTFSGVLIETDRETGLVTKINAVTDEGELLPNMPFSS